MKTKNVLMSMSRRGLLMLAILTMISTNAWGASITYTFNSLSWGASPSNWTGSANGNGYTSGQGIQCTTSQSGVTATSPSSFTAITKVVVTYNTNKSAGAGSMTIKIGTNSETDANSVAYSSGDGRSSNYTTTFNFSPAQTGSVVLKTNVTKNSIWPKSVTIYYQTDITLAANGGAANKSAKYNHEGTTYAAFTAVTRDGYNCTGYWTASSGGTKILNADGSLAGANITVSTVPYTSSSKWVYAGGTLTLYAQWEAAGTSVSLSKGAETNGSFTLSPASSVTTTSSAQTVTVSCSPNAGYYVSAISATNPATCPSDITYGGSNNSRTVTYPTGANGSSTISVTFSPIWYLKGSFNSYDNSKPLTTIADGVASTTVTLAKNTKYLFQFYDATQATDAARYYGDNGNIVEDISGWTFATGSPSPDCKIFTGPAGSYTFKINMSTKAVQVIYPEVDHPADCYVYFKKWADWSNNYYVHWWGASTLQDYNSAIRVTKTYTTCGTDYVYFPILADYPNFLVKDAASGDGSHKTGDLSSTSHGGMYHDCTSWNTFSTYSITFAGNGNTGGSMSNVTEICSGSDVTLVTNGYTKSDHNFTGWKTNAALTYVANGDADDGTHEVDVAVNGIVPNQAKIKRISSNITLTAQWEHVPVITVSQTSRAFGDRKVNGGPYEMTFNVEGSYLKGNISLAVSGTNAAMFSVSPTSLSPTTGTVSSTEITVSYSPTGAGSHTAQVDITSSGATSKTVTLTGTGKWEVTWNNNNGSTSTTLVANSTKPTFPSTPGSCDGTSTTFIGWATAAWTGKLPSLAGKTVHTSNSTMSAVTANGTTYYAVFAAGTGTPSDEYQLVTDISQLSAGDKIVIGNAQTTSTYLMSKDTTTATGYQFRRVAQSGTFTISSSKVTVSTPATSSTDRNNPHVLTVGKSGDYWTFYDPLLTAYVSCVSTSSKNSLGYEAELSDAGKWGISISSNQATILSQISNETTTRNRLQANGNPFGAGSSFTCTANSQNDPYIFRNLSTISYSDYMTTCCDKQVTLSATVTGSVGGTVAFSPVSPIATCSATAAERKTTVTVTPATGYKLTGWTKAVSGISLPDSTSAISTSSGNAAVQTNTYTFAQNANGSMSVTATFTMMVDHYIDRLHNKTGYTGDGMVKNTVGYTIPNPGDASEPADDSCAEAHYKFIGWIAEEYVDTDGTLLDASKLFTASGTKNPSDTNFLAVWAKTE